ncbi:MAG: peptide chain release factor N(5)-glutamine methyltransferase [Candidatus Omnitrophota bacterium]
MNEAELLFTEILDYERVDLYQNKRFCLDKDKASLAASVLKRRIRGEPLQYILGKTEFMGLKFKVNQDVFIPRPETEILVETVINLVRSSGIGARSILDLGTGSGCIAVSVAKFLPNTNITATDISESAIRIAKQNAVINNAKINFLCSDLFNNSELQTMNYELIISNPPYIPTDEIATLQPEISYEPQIALDGGREGMDFYRRIISVAAGYLEREGFLVLEMGYNQLGPIRKLFENSGCLEIIEVVKDYNHIDRVIVARKIPNPNTQITNKL